VKYKFEAIIWVPDEEDVAPNEEYLDLIAFRYGDRHSDFNLSVVPGTIEKVEE
jgi:hypothetical protein